MPFATSGFAAVAQDHITRGIASNFYPKAPFVAALGSFTLTRNQRTSLNIGRPEGEILTGKTISPAEVLDLENFNNWKPRIQQFETDNSAWMGKYTNSPVVSNPTTNAHSQAMQGTADFRRCRLKTPILIWHDDKDRALSKGSPEGQGIAMSQLIDEATEIAYQEHVKKLVAGLWTGNPTSQDSDPWDQPLGILQALDTTNTYGRVDRTSIPSTSAWLAKKDAAFTAADVQKLTDDANLVKQLRVVGAGFDLGIVPVALYQLFKAQVAGKQGVRVLSDGLPGMTSMGQTQEALQVDNTYWIYDPSCPANTALTLTTDTWKLAIRPGKNLTVSAFVDLSDKAEGAKEADQAFIETEFIFGCGNPGLNCRYTAIGT